MTLMDNAASAFRTAFSDFQSGEADRALSAVRGASAGILLFFKEALRRLSPDNSNEVLVKSQIVPVRVAGGGVGFVGKGKKTVNVPQIEERFEGLGGISGLETIQAVADAPEQH